VSDLRVVVVDDEPLAREGLVELLEQQPGVVIAGAFADAVSALVGLEAVKPDALFVDIRMPGMSGIELVEALDSDPLPAVVFVTAYDAYAIRAFEVNAVDYLLKPVSSERLTLTLERLRSQSREPGGTATRDRHTALFDGLLPGRPRGAGRLIVREVGQVIVVATRDVDWIEGADYYAKLHVGPKIHMLRESMTSLEQRLDPERFLRINRSAIVNLTRIRAVESHVRGEGLVVLHNDTRLKVTRARRDDLEKKLESLHDTE
jgi:two-component system, LytTR family, response regulator